MTIWVVETYSCDGATVQGVFASRLDAVAVGYAMTLGQWFEWTRLWLDDPEHRYEGAHHLVQQNDNVLWSAWPYDSVAVTAYDVHEDAASWLGEVGAC